MGRTEARRPLAIHFTAAQRRAIAIEVAIYRTLGSVSLVVLVLNIYYTFSAVANSSAFRDPVLGSVVGLTSDGWLATVAVAIVFVGTYIALTFITRVRSVDLRCAFRWAEIAPLASAAVPLPAAVVAERLAQAARGRPAAEGWTLGAVVVEGDGKRLVLLRAPRGTDCDMAVIEAEAPAAAGGVCVVSTCPPYRRAWFPLLLLAVLLPCSQRSVESHAPGSAPRLARLPPSAGQRRPGPTTAATGFEVSRNPARHQRFGGVPRGLNPLAASAAMLAIIAWGGWILWSGRRAQLRTRLAAALESVTGRI
jgi:hypothetical protein